MGSAQALDQGRIVLGHPELGGTNFEVSWMLTRFSIGNYQVFFHVFVDTQSSGDKLKHLNVIKKIRPQKDQNT